jgi:hypothetical protein
MNSVYCQPLLRSGMTSSTNIIPVCLTSLSLGFQTDISTGKNRQQQKVTRSHRTRTALLMLNKKHVATLCYPLSTKKHGNLNGITASCKLRPCLVNCRFWKGAIERYNSTSCSQYLYSYPVAYISCLHWDFSYFLLVFLKANIKRAPQSIDRPFPSQSPHTKMVWFWWRVDWAGQAMYV